MSLLYIIGITIPVHDMCAGICISATEKELDLKNSKKVVDKVKRAW